MSVVTEFISYNKIDTFNMASDGTKGEKYRSFLDTENVKVVQWRFGAPPKYDVVNKLFEDGQTKVIFSNTIAT